MYVSSHGDVIIIVSGVKVDTIHPGSLTKIPSFDIVTQAISMLCKKRECVSSNSFLYIKFSLILESLD